MIYIPSYTIAFSSRMAETPNDSLYLYAITRDLYNVYLMNPWCFAVPYSVHPDHRPWRTSRAGTRISVPSPTVCRSCGRWHLLLLYSCPCWSSSHTHSRSWRVCEVLTSLLLPAIRSVSSAKRRLPNYLHPMGIEVWWPWSVSPMIFPKKDVEHHRG